MKEILKNIKMHESTISTFFGFVVIVVVGLLVINYFRNVDNNGGEAFPNGASTENVGDISNGYEVQEGDTLWTIAEDQYGSGFEWERIANANDISIPDDIEEGQTLTIPDMEEKAAQPDETEEDTTSTNEVLAQDNQEQVLPESESYTVQRGDNLWEIAEDHYGDGYRWVDIAEANDLANPNIIHMGNVLEIPR